jgi:hypothetical protein
MRKKSASSGSSFAEAWNRRHNVCDGALVFTFGSTPIFTRNYQSAIRLAMYCQLNGPPSGLCWINACPDDRKGAIEFASRRRADEALRPESRPH